MKGDRVFSLTKEGHLRWRLSGVDSSGCRRRPYVDAESLEDAILQAASVLYDDHRLGSRPNDHPHLSIEEALSQALRCSQCGDERWEDLRLSHVVEYVGNLRDRGLKQNTIKRYLEPVRETSLRMAEMYPEHYRHALAAFKLRKDAGRSGHYDESEGTRALTIAEVVSFYNWLEDHPHASSLQLAVLLCGLMGLRLREAIFLTWGNIDLIGGTITIQDEPGHRVKNGYSIRRLPMPLLVTDHLRGLVGGCGSDRVLSLVSQRIEMRTSTRPDNLLGQRLRSSLLRWDSDRGDLPGNDLRNTLQDAALKDQTRWNVYLVDRYVGHAPRSIMERHYADNQRGRLVDAFREKVVPLIDEAVDEALGRPKRTDLAQKGQTPEVEAPGPEAQIFEIGALA
ncbi:MAG: Phage integrase family [Candidatus Sumerlaeota bacterium]|nr:Phage integrase family [Candidatus Sumerlaeota bacterium]